MALIPGIFFPLTNCTSTHPHFMRSFLLAKTSLILGGLTLQTFSSSGSIYIQRPHNLCFYPLFPCSILAHFLFTSSAVEMAPRPSSLCRCYISMTPQSILPLFYVVLAHGCLCLLCMAACRHMALFLWPCMKYAFYGSSAAEAGGQMDGCLIRDHTS